MPATRWAFCRLGAGLCDALIWKLGSGERDQDRRKPLGFKTATTNQNQMAKICKTQSRFADWGEEDESSAFFWSVARAAL